MPDVWLVVPALVVAVTPLLEVELLVPLFVAERLIPLLELEVALALPLLPLYPVGRRGVAVASAASVGWRTVADAAAAISGGRVEGAVLSVVLHH